MMTLEFNTDYFLDFKKGRDNYVVIEYDNMDREWKPMFFKTEADATEYLNEKLKEDPLSLTPDAAVCFCVAKVTATVGVKYSIEANV